MVKVVENLESDATAEKQERVLPGVVIHIGHRPCGPASWCPLPTSSCLLSPA